MIDAIVLCGGLGTRLRPLTYAIPKPLLPVGGIPILEHILRRLEAAGHRHIGLATGFRSELLEGRLGGRYGEARLTFRREPAALGTGGALNLFRGETAASFVLMNGDLLTDLDLGALRDLHRRRDAAITMAVRMLPVAVAYGVVDTDGDAVTGIREKPEVPVPINAGVYQLSSQIWDLLDEGPSPVTDLVERCLAGGRTVAAYHFTDYWIDIGAMPDYLQANEDLALAQGLGPPQEAPRQTSGAAG